MVYLSRFPFSFFFVVFAFKIASDRPWISRFFLALFALHKLMTKTEAGFRKQNRLCIFAVTETACRTINKLIFIFNAQTAIYYEVVSIKSTRAITDSIIDTIIDVFF